MNEIVHAVQAIKSDTDRTVIYPAVYRMARDGRLRKRGEKYFPPDMEAAAK